MKNQKEVLVPAGRWSVSGCRYGASKCECCGRPIRRVLKLKNLDHEAKKGIDHEYKFNEEIEIGCVCGPKVFKESCIGYYDNPEMEWLRQWNAIKDFMNYLVMCHTDDGAWEMLPLTLREKFDAYLNEGFTSQVFSGDWHRVMDAKKRWIVKMKAAINDKYTHPSTRQWTIDGALRGIGYTARRRGWLVNGEGVFFQDDGSIQVVQLASPQRLW